MTRLRRALAGAPAAPIPTRRSWLDRWVNGMRITYLRDRIADVESHIEHQRAAIKKNELDLQAMRVRLDLLEN